jgi:hypothetical protein
LDAIEGQRWLIERELGDSGINERGFDGDDRSSAQSKYVVGSSFVNQRFKVFYFSTQTVKVPVVGARGATTPIGNVHSEIVREAMRKFAEILCGLARTMNQDQRRAIANFAVANGRSVS